MHHNAKVQVYLSNSKDFQSRKLTFSWACRIPRSGMRSAVFSWVSCASLLVLNLNLRRPGRQKPIKSYFLRNISRPSPILAREVFTFDQYKTDHYSFYRRSLPTVHFSRPLTSEWWRPWRVSRCVSVECSILIYSLTLWPGLRSRSSSG